MGRKKFLIALDEAAHQRMKIMAARFRCSIGDVIESTMFLNRTGELKDEAILGAVMFLKNNPPMAGWVADDHAELKAGFAKLRDLARAEGKEETAKQAEEKLAQLHRDYPDAK